MTKMKRSRLKSGDIAFLSILLWVAFLAIFHMAVVIYITVGVSLAILIYGWVRYFQKRPYTRTQINILSFCVVGLALGLPFVWKYNVQIYFYTAAGIFAAGFIYWNLRKLQRREIITSDIDRFLHLALETMDSTAKWYNDEEEANRELVTCLKAQGVNDVVYQYRLNNGRTVDARVGNCLIEGKLSPTTEEVDRLIGQTCDYIRYTKKLHIIIYGEFSRDARRRVENEIHTRFPNQVFLTYLNNPRRLRNTFA